MIVSHEIRDPVLTFNQLTVSYPGRRASPVLNDFSFELEAGIFLAVVGPSGCGKSTLLHTTAGFIKPIHGEIRLEGRVVSEPSVKVGFVSQRYALFPWLTVEENISFGLRSKNLTASEKTAAVCALIEVIGLTEHRHDYPEQLSGGMQQRVALARAMAPEPSVLLLDEPFSALDSETRHNMRELLLRLWIDHSVTIMFVTHDLEEAILLADKILILGRKANLTRTIPVPYPRPRLDTILHDKIFLDIANSIRTTPAYLIK